MKDEDQALQFLSTICIHPTTKMMVYTFLIVKHFFFFSLVSIDYFAFSFVSLREVCISAWLVCPHHQSEFIGKGDSNEE